MYFWHAWPRSDARRVREPDHWVSSGMTYVPHCATSCSRTYSWSYSWTYSWRGILEHVLGLKTMTSLILDHIATAYLYLGINTREKVMILFLVIVLELSQDWSWSTSMIRDPFFCRSVAAIFEYTAYSKLAAGKISNIGIFEFTYVFSNLHGHFVARYRM
jgi:hypothetical protein